MASGGVGNARAKTLSALAVERLKESAFVGGAPGLQLLVSPGGARSWRLFYRLPGGGRKAMSLGRYPAVSLADARRRAGEALAQISDGLDPKAARERKAARAVLTVDAALNTYLDACLAANDAATVRDKASAFAGHVRPPLGSSPLAGVTRAQWMGVLDALATRPARRRNLYAYLHHFLAWALERELIAANPLSGVRAPKPVTARERVVSDEEVVAFWGLGGETATLARLALLTAQRQGSLAAMRWDGLDFKQKLWRIPKEAMKSGKAHDVPLSGTALDILRARPRMSGPFVFGVGSFGAAPYQGFSNGMEALRAQLAPCEEPWRFHDLRRTAVTWAQRAGCPLDAVRALTQHKTPGIIGVYARHAFAEEKRLVVEGIERELKQLLSL